MSEPCRKRQGDTRPQAGVSERNRREAAALGAEMGYGACDDERYDFPRARAY